MYSYSYDDGSDCKKQVLPAIFSIYSECMYHVSREGKSPTPMAMAVESYGYFLPAEKMWQCCCARKAELPPCLQGRKVTQPHGDGGGKLWVLFAYRKNVAMVFRKGSGVTPMARVAVDACATLATGNAPPK